MVIGPLMFCASVALAARDIKELGLSWIWWAVIGGVLLVASGIAIIYGQHREINTLQKELNMQADASSAKQVSSRFFSIQFWGDIAFGRPGASGFPESPSGDLLMLRLLVGFIAIPDMEVESVTLEIMGKRIPSNWVPAGVGQNYTQYVYFGIPNWVNPGQHSVKLFAFTDGKEWSSEEFQISFPEQKVILV